MRKVRVGTRESRLALAQTESVIAFLAERFPGLPLEMVKMKTEGDILLGQPLAEIGGKGLFVKELEKGLLDGTVDFAVHSLKDLPTDLPPGLFLAAVGEREDPRDALVSPSGRLFAELPSGARIGTSSLRRAAQLRRARPDLEIISVRGNLQTRLRKLESERLDGLVLAAAGLHRLGLSHLVTEILPAEISLPAVGQGALGLEAREGDQEILDILASFNHEPTAIACWAERAFLRELGGGCQVPIGALGEIREGSLRLRGLIASPDGRAFVAGEREGPAGEAELIGAELGRELLLRGGDGILEGWRRDG